MRVLSKRTNAFYIPAHEIIYSLVLEFGDKRKPIEFVLLKQALKDRNQLEENGGPEYLSDLYNFVPTAANVGYYIDIVRKKYVLRGLFPPTTGFRLSVTINSGKSNSCWMKLRKRFLRSPEST